MNNWNEIIKVENITDIKDKEFIVKCLLFKKLVTKYRTRTEKVRIYTDFYIDGIKTDLYLEKYESHEAFIYILKDKLIEKESQILNKHKPLFFKEVRIVLINVKDLSDNITELIKELEEYE